MPSIRTKEIHSTEPAYVLSVLHRMKVAAYSPCLRNLQNKSHSNLQADKASSIENSSRRVNRT